MKNLPDFIESCEVARLIPVAPDSSKERKTLSVFLAAIRGVFEFRQAVFKSLGIKVGNRATINAWTEVVFSEDPKEKEKKPKKNRPDGFLILNTGRKQWKALVEAKVGNAQIDEKQLQEYLQLAKQHKLDAVITISNQFAAIPSHHPVKLPKIFTKTVALYHWSWTYLLTQALLLLEGGEVECPDQHFLLEEVVRYMRHKTSGISRFESMNPEWKEVVGQVKRNAALDKASEKVENTVSSWHQEQRDLCLLMSHKLGRPVKLRLSSAHRKDPQKRIRDDIEVLVKNKILACALEIPNAAADLNITADLSTRTIICSMYLNAPLDKKRPSAKVNWLTRQLNGICPTDIHIRALRSRAKTTEEPLAGLLKNPDALTSNASDPAPTAFEIYYVVDLAGRFSGSKVFIDELERAVPYFYEQAGQRLRAWVASPPKIKYVEQAEKEEAEREDPQGNADEADQAG